MHWETKTFMGSLYCNICFITVVWSPTFNISEVGLYTEASRSTPDKNLMLKKKKKQ